MSNPVILSFDDDGNVVSIVGCCNGIAELREAMAELRMVDLW